MNMLNNIILKLTSRKLWLAIAGIATGVAIALGVDGGEITNVAGAITALASVITYIVTEGKIDAESVKQNIEVIDATMDDVLDSEVDEYEFD